MAYANQPALGLKHKPQIFHTKNVAECLEVMDAIRKKGDPVAFDAEGVRLGAEGRMTLLQICTWDGRIYLLDLIDADRPYDRQVGKKLLIDGGVKEMLESADVEKVTHAASQDSAAFSAQYGIQLISTQIFDTQSADAAVRFLAGTVFPSRRNLGQLTETYGTPQHPLKDAHTKWLAEDKEIWAKRPLPQKLIDYASYDVSILMPELYNKLRSIIDEKDGWTCYRQIVGWNLRFETDRAGVGAEEALARKETVKKIFGQMEDNYTPDTKIANLSEDERSLLGVIIKHRNVWKMPINPTVEALEKKLQLEFIAEVKREVQVNPPGHFVEGYKMYRLFLLGSHLNPAIREAASALRSGINRSAKRSGINKRNPNMHLQSFLY